MSVERGQEFVVDEDALRAFVTESNRIERINRPPLREELDAHLRFFGLEKITVGNLERFVECTAGGKLRRFPGMDVQFGPAGGEHIGLQLRALLDDLCPDPYELHCAYETLHPFTDGNGRSGRALWVWHMFRNGHDPFELPFLQRWYYDSLTGSR